MLSACTSDSGDKDVLAAQEEARRLQQARLLSSANWSCWHPWKRYLKVWIPARLESAQRDSSGLKKDFACCSELRVAPASRVDLLDEAGNAKQLAADLTQKAWCVLPTRQSYTIALQDESGQLRPLTCKLYSA